jgi:hypothetical protein
VAVAVPPRLEALRAPSIRQHPERAGRLRVSAALVDEKYANQLRWCSVLNNRMPARSSKELQISSVLALRKRLNPRLRF